MLYASYTHTGYLKISMATINRTLAQARADQIRSFRLEQAALAEQGILLPSDTNQAVHQYHQQLLRELQQAQDVDLSAGAQHLSLGMQIVSFLGACALAASLFFLFYQYWGYFDCVVQVSILIATPVLSLSVALWIARFDSSGYYAKLAALISFVSWVLNISMLGSIFNITASPNAFAVFSLYGFLLAYLLHVRLLLAAGIICACIFIGAKFGTWMGSYWIYMGKNPEHFLISALLFFILPITLDQSRFNGFTRIYQVFSTIIFFVSVLILSNWGWASYLPWPVEVIEGCYQVAGFITSAFLVAYGLRRHNAQLMLTGNVFFALFLYTKFFDWWWDWMPKYLFFLMIGLTAVLALAIFNRLRKVQQTGGHQ